MGHRPPRDRASGRPNSSARISPSISARLDALPARQWRNLQDTTYDPIIAERAPKPWQSWQRREDYYREGALVWLEIDQMLRSETNGRRSLDDFARLFFGGEDGDFGEVTYTFEDIVGTLDEIHPHDWATLLRARLDTTGGGAPMRGAELGGYRLGWSNEPGDVMKASQTAGEYPTSPGRGGLTVGKTGEITGVIWDSPAYDAGLTVGTRIVAVNSYAFSRDLLRDAVAAAVGGQSAIEPSLKDGSRYRTATLAWTGGLRYPRLEMDGQRDGGTHRLIAPRPR